MPGNQNEADPKSEIRGAILRLRLAQPAEEALRKSLTIAGHLAALPEYRSAQTVMLYAAVRGEVDTGALMARVISDGKKLVLPRAVPETRELELRRVSDPPSELAPGNYGIPEPLSGTEIIPAESVDLVAVPGVAFDRRGNRLGYGAGYYDRFLGRRGGGGSPPAPRPVAVGLAFEFQVVDELPAGEHDRSVHILVTESGARRVADELGG